jgi:hypothetical protein|tara:strand:- start:3092 stop:3688 length:597 start_codon:yes stop_codon:yes gene_type:complete
MSDTDEMKMTGLILAQSALVGVAVGVFSAGLWLPSGNDADSTINGMTYAMGALAVQTIAYYIFKMFFEQNMKERVQVAEMQRARQEQFRMQQTNFDQRRLDLELRVQEMQLENELRLLQQDPSRITPNYNNGDVSGTGVDYHNTFNPGIPLHNAESQQPLNLGALNTMADEMMENQSSVPLKKDGTPDLRYKSQRGDN